MIVLERLTKVYDTLNAVDHIDLVIPSGQLIGYLGPNGAGKSTTVKMLTGMIAPTSGRAEIYGLDVQQQSTAVKRLIGYVPESSAVYETLTRFLARA